LINAFIMKKFRTYLWIALMAFAVFCAAVFLAANHRTIVHETQSPRGGYIAKLSVKTFHSFMPMMPGSGSDKPGYVEIVNKDGDSMGEIPVPMLQDAGVIWVPNGAQLKVIGEWDFANGTCFYWDETGNKRIYVKGEASD
jgi:hypothetical protein